MDLRMKCQTEMSRGPLAEDEHSRKEIVGWVGGGGSWLEILLMSMDCTIRRIF